MINTIIGKSRHRHVGIYIHLLIALASILENICQRYRAEYYSKFFKRAILHKPHWKISVVWLVFNEIVGIDPKPAT